MFEGRPFLSNDILVQVFFPPLVGALRFFLLLLLLVLTVHQQLRELLAYFGAFSLAFSVPLSLT